MRQVIASIVLLFSFLFPAFGQRKACDELKAEIAAKLEAKNVKNYTLTIVSAQDVKDGDKVVGSCDGGTMRIIYKRD